MGLRALVGADAAFLPDAGVIAIVLSCFRPSRGGGPVNRFEASVRIAYKSICAADMRKRVAQIETARARR